MEKVEYRLVQEEKAVYKVQENCCFTKVVFEGPAKGIYLRLDRDNELIGTLLCYCDPQKEILPISEEFYQTYFNLVKESQFKA